MADGGVAWGVSWRIWPAPFMRSLFRQSPQTLKSRQQRGAATRHRAPVARRESAPCGASRGCAASSRSGSSAASSPPRCRRPAMSPRPVRSGTRWEARGGGRFRPISGELGQARAISILRVPKRSTGQAPNSKQHDLSPTNFGPKSVRLDRNQPRVWNDQERAAAIGPSLRGPAVALRFAQFGTFQDSFRLSEWPHWSKRWRAAAPPRSEAAEAWTPRATSARLALRLRLGEKWQEALRDAEGSLASVYDALLATGRLQAVEGQAAATRDLARLPAALAEARERRRSWEAEQAPRTHSYWGIREVSLVDSWTLFGVSRVSPGVARRGPPRLAILGVTSFCPNPKLEIPLRKGSYVYVSRATGQKTRNSAPRRCGSVIARPAIVWVPRPPGVSGDQISEEGSNVRRRGWSLALAKEAGLIDARLLATPFFAFLRPPSWSDSSRTNVVPSPGVTPNWPDSCNISPRSGGFRPDVCRNRAKIGRPASGRSAVRLRGIARALARAPTSAWAGAAEAAWARHLVVCASC